MGTVQQIASVENGKLVVNMAAMGSILDKVGVRPVAIVSINGPTRSGKSYLLNHFLRYLLSQGQGDWFHKDLVQQFHWQSSSERQTTGILAWSEPLTVYDERGHEVAVLLVDTQGSFDDQTTMAENALVFAFSCLLSSVLVYNFKNQLSEDVLQFLQTFLGHTKAIGGEDRSSRLVFVVRDWQCPMDFAFGYHDNGHSPGPRNFKTERLDESPSMTAEAAAVRHEIASSFGGLACSLMPYPGHDLALYDRAQNLEPMFVQAVQELVPHLFRGMVPKKIAGHPITGIELKTLVQTWAQLFANDAALPAALSLAEATAEMQNSAAHVAARDLYQKQMDVVHQRDGMSEQEFQELHAAKRADAVAVFWKSPRLHHDAVQQRYVDRLNSDIGQIYGSLHALNVTKRQSREQREAAEQEARRIQEEAQRKIAEAQNNKHHKRWYPRISKRHFRF